VKFVATLALAIVFTIPFSVAAQVPKKTGSAKPALSEWVLRRRLMRSPHNKDLHRTLCNLLDKQKKYRDLENERAAWLTNNITDLNEVIAIDAEAQFLLNDDEFAIAATRKYLAALDPDDIMLGWANNLLGRELMRRGKLAEAIPYLRKAVEKNREHGDYWEALGNALIGDGQTAAAISTLKHAVEVQQSSAEVHASLARALDKSGDLPNAEAEYIAASNLDEDNAVRLTTLARFQIKRREFADAKDTIDRALKTHPMDLYAYLLRARIFELEGQPDRAALERNKADGLLRDDMRKSKSKSAENTAVPLAIFAIGDSEELVRLEETNAANLTSSDRMMLFIANLDLGRKNEALAELPKIFDDPKANTAKDNFLVAEGLKGANLSQEAEKFYRKAYEIDPQNLTYRFELNAIRNSWANR